MYGGIQPGWLSHICNYILSKKSTVLTTVHLEDIRDRFSFLLNLNSVIIEDEKERKILRKECSDFAACYDNDVTADMMKWLTL